MRNGIIHAISRVISSVLVKDNSETSIKTRDSLLGILQERLRDTNAYTRSKVIQCWGHLCKEKAVPLNVLPEIVDTIIGRLHDKSAFVRKAAVQFLITILEYNPYGHSLQKSHYQTKLNEAKNSLNEATDNQEKQKYTTLIAYSTEALKFIEQIETAIPVAIRLLNSKTSSDVLECVRLFSCAYAFKIDGSVAGIRSILKLVWSREQAVKDGVIEEFKNIFFSQPLNSPEACIAVALNMIQVVLSCNFAEHRAMEAIITELAAKEELPDKLILALWEIYTLNAPNITDKDSVGAIVLLGMIANSQPQIVKKKLKTLIRTGLGDRGKVCNSIILINNFRNFLNSQDILVEF